MANCKTRTNKKQLVWFILNSSVWFFFAVTLVTSALAQPVHKAEPSLWESETLTGDWNGLRSSWSEKGVDLSIEYHAEVMGVVSGGIRRGVIYEGLGQGTLDADLERLIGWRKLSFRVSTLWTHGASPSGKMLGSVSDEFKSPSTTRSSSTRAPRCSAARTMRACAMRL